MTSTSGSAKKKSSKMYTSNGYMLFRKEFNKDNKFSNFNDMNKESSKAWRALSVDEKTVYTDRAKRGRGENKKDTIGMLYTMKDGKDKANKDSSERTFVASLDPVLRDLHGKLMGVINDNHNRLVVAMDDELRKVQDHIQRQRKQQEEDGDDDDENGQEEDEHKNSSWSDQGPYRTSAHQPTSVPLSNHNHRCCNLYAQVASTVRWLSTTNLADMISRLGGTNASSSMMVSLEAENPLSMPPLSNPSGKEVTNNEPDAIAELETFKNSSMETKLQPIPSFSEFVSNKKEKGDQRRTKQEHSPRVEKRSSYHSYLRLKAPAFVC